MRRVTLPTLVATTLLTGVVLPLSLPTGAQAASGITGLVATLTQPQTWQSGFEADYTITNDTKATVNSWSLAFDLPTGESVSSTWNGTLTSTATSTGTHYTVTSPSWAAPLAPGASAPAVGMDIATTGTQVPPANCLINNQPCAGVPVSNTPPTVPAGLAVSGTGPDAVSLSWNASTDPSGVAGYNVYEGSSVVASTTTATKVTVNGLLAGSSHTFTVTAFDALGNESAQSAPVTGVAGSGTSPAWPPPSSTWAPTPPPTWRRSPRPPASSSSRWASS